jgi:GH25 family lysozyme M1 (1,4-beta-N-acetylmuramidase)
MQKWIDISFWQGTIDWDLLKKDADGVIIKVIEGNWVDKKFKEYHREARRVGLKVQYYAFYRPWIAGEKQAELFVDLTKQDPGDLPLVIDWEAGIPEANAYAVSMSAKKMAETITILSGGTKPWIYTAKWFIDRVLSGCWTTGQRERRLGWAREYPALWKAEYPWERRKDFVQNYLVYENLAFNPASKPKPCWPWTEVKAWQFTGHGRVDGIRGDADINVYYL